ncbi:MAG: LysR family transcriptional regulator [Ruegeria sp.]|uniref:LysR family transcriptional regulator n=1 Tax=Ruegeria sp. TaxID=1879320 RepID=UPI00349EF01E
MNLQQLAVFREVMKTGSVSQAARNLHRTQPAVSASLKALEADLGMDLFLRDGRRMIPAPEAHYLLSEASEVLDKLTIAKQNLTSMRDRLKGSLRIVAMPGPSSVLLPSFISRFIVDKPETQVSLATRSSPQVRNLIAAQSFDVGFCDIGAGVHDDKLFLGESIPCTCLCALPRGHPLAQKEVVNARDLDGVPMGALQPEHSTYRDTHSAFAAVGARFNIRIDSQYFLPLFHFIEAGQICAVVDVLSAVSYRQSNPTDPKIVFRPLTPSVDFGYAILTPHQRPLSRLASAFVTSWKAWVEEAIETVLDPEAAA